MRVAGGPCSLANLARVFYSSPICLSHLVGWLKFFISWSCLCLFVTPHLLCMNPNSTEDRDTTVTSHFGGHQSMTSDYSSRVDLKSNATKIA